MSEFLPGGKIEKGELSAGPDGFCLVQFPKEQPFSCQVPNLWLETQAKGQGLKLKRARAKAAPVACVIFLAAMLSKPASSKGEYCLQDLRPCGSCGTNSYLRKGYCVNILCKDYYMLKPASARLWQRGPADHKQEWDPKSWSSKTHDKVCQAHLQSEFLQLEEASDDDYEPSSSAKRIETPGPTIEEVLSSDEETLRVMSSGEEKNYDEGKKIKWEHVFKGYHDHRLQKKFADYLRSAIQRSAKVSGSGS